MEPQGGRFSEKIPILNDKYYSIKKLALALIAAGLLLLGILIGIRCATSSPETAQPATGAPAAAPATGAATNVNASTGATTNIPTGGTNTNTSAPSTGATAPLPTDQGGDINGPIGPGPAGF